jgi:hypothetical protein
MRGMPRKVNASDARTYWASGMANAGPKITAGIDRVTTAPGQKAAAKKDKYVAGVTASQDLWARRVAAVDLGTWQTRAKAGVSRIAEGAQQKGDKYETAVAPVFAHMDSVLSRVDSMPDNTLEQRIQKSAEYQRGMAQYKARGGA